MTTTRWTVSVTVSTLFLGNPVPTAEGRVTLIGGLPATALLTGLILNATPSWWGPIPQPGTTGALS
jgi:hypothetical protein